MSHRPAVAVLGLGAMGSRMALKLLQAGYPVAVWNRTQVAAMCELVGLGARRAATPRAAAEGADLVLSVVRDDAASRQVWLDVDGACAGLSPKAVAIESSTLSLAWVRELAAAMAAQGQMFLDAPVLGSRAQAEAASLVYVVGGEPQTLDRVRDALTCLGSAAHHMGPAGSGAAAKLLLNAMLGVQVAALAELLAVARANLDVSRFQDVFGMTAVCSPAAKAALDGMVAGAFAPAFPVALIDKDLRYLLEAAGDAGAAPLVRSTLEVFERGQSAGYGELNMTAVSRLYR